MKKLFLLVFLYSISAFAEVHEIEYEGRTISIEEDNPYRNELVQLSESRSPSREGGHTVRAYGSMWVTFMASMIATELAYCNNHLMPLIANNDETPTCRSELQMMLFDPGMNLGVMAMTATSIEVFKRGDRVLIKLMRRLTRGTKALKLSRVMLQHLAMGAGMIVQTSIASSWNAPQMRKCMGNIYSSVKGALTANGVEDLYADEAKTQDVVSTATQEAHETSDCVKARQEFWNAETGTLSEINITVLSLGISSVISGALVTSIRFAGMVLLGWTPGGLALTAGLILAEPVIEMVDRVLEPIIRAFYHSWRSKRLLSNSFLDLISSLDQYKEEQNFVTTSSYTICKRYNYPPELMYYTYHSDLKCEEEETITNHSFAIREALDDYKKNIEYRKRAKLNRFIETQGRWKQKLSNIFTVLKSFQNMMTMVYELREERRVHQLVDHQYFYNPLAPLTYVPEPLQISEQTVPELLVYRSSLSQEQITKVYEEIFRPLAAKIRTPRIKNRNQRLREVLLELDTTFKNGWEPHKVRAGLWKLKALFSPEWVDFNYGPRRLSDGLYGHVCDRSEVREIREKITNAISSFDAYKVKDHIRFESEGEPFLEEIRAAEGVEEDSSAPSALRRGVMLEGSPASSALLLMNKDDGIPFRSNETAFWTNRVNQGLSASKLSSKITTHLLCGESPNGLDFFWRDGNESKLVLPNILKNPDLLDCNYNDRVTDFAVPQDDYYYNKDTGEVKRFFTDEAMHRIFKYAGHERIGLMEILLDPNTELIWETQEDFNQAWNTQLRPKFFKFLLQARQEYFESLESYFKLFGEQHGAYATSSLISEEEIDSRGRSSRNKAYYQNIFTGDAFVDEVRTYEYLIKSLTGEGSEDSQILAALVSDFHRLVHHLDTSEQDFQFDHGALSESDVEERMYRSPLGDVFGAEIIGSYVSLHAALKQKIQSRSSELENASHYNDLKEDELTAEQAKELILYKVYKNTNESLDSLFNLILKEYIGGASITYLYE